MDQQMTLPLQGARRRVLLAENNPGPVCPILRVPQGLSLDVLGAKTFYSCRMDAGLPVRDGFYGLISEAKTGKYRSMAWFEVKTGIWWDATCKQPINLEGISSWYGLTAELGGRRRRRLLQPLD